MEICNAIIDGGTLLTILEKYELIEIIAVYAME